MTSKEDFYVILEVGRTASVNDIKRAFRRLARRFHPDVNPGDRLAEDHFKRITEAYEILSDPLKRQFYDVNGFYTEGILEFDFARQDRSQFSDIFSQFFARQAMRRDPEHGQDLEYPISISFDDSIRGLTARISVLRQFVCGACTGGGQAKATRESLCRICGGAGKTTKSKGHLQFSVTCGECGGSGRSVAFCHACNGEGRVPGSETLEVQLPPGVTTGSRIRISGKGDAGRFGGSAGDLYVVVNAAAHPFFKRIGDNVHCTVSLTITEAALGAKVEVPTIDGRAVVRIPPGTQTGQKFRLRERGAPSLLNPGMRGDQYVEVKVVTPRVADERSKEILRELGKLNPANPRDEIWK